MGTKPGSRRGRGRRALFWAALLYALATVVVNAAIDGGWRQLRSAPLVDILHQLEECPPGRPDVVCIGTSRLAMAFSGDEVRQQLSQLTGDSDIDVLNASTGSQDLISADYVMEQVLARGARPALAIIEVAPELLSRHDLWLGCHVMPAPTTANLGIYAGDLCRAWTNIPELLADRAYPLYRCRRQLWMVAGNTLADRHGVDLNPPDAENWARRAAKTRSASPAELEAQGTIAASLFLDTDQTRQRQERVAAGLRTIRRWLNDYQVGGLACEALDHLLQRCREHGVCVLLVVPPVASEQRALYTADIESAFQDCLLDFQRRYGCPIVDCRSYLPDACFNDNHHVCIPQGSLPFSRRLTREVLVPEWRARREGVSPPRKQGRVLSRS